MTANEFRKMALALPGAIESAHMNHPDFRVEGKIFASLGYPGAEWGMVKLTPAQQRAFMKKSSGAFRPCNGLSGGMPLGLKQNGQFFVVDDFNLTGRLTDLTGSLTGCSEKEPNLYADPDGLTGFYPYAGGTPPGVHGLPHGLTGFYP